MPRPGRDETALTFIGHSSFLFQRGASAILIDPVFSRNAGPFGILGPRRVREPGVRFSDLPRIGLVLVSHNHYDHLDKPTLRALARRDAPVFVTPVGNGPAIRRLGAQHVAELDWWDSVDVGAVTITATPAQHFSARSPFDRNRALWSGFVVQCEGRTVYHAGDTAYMNAFADIRRRFGTLDAAILPIGAYEPRWFMQALHMNPADAVQAHLDLEPRLSIASHFGTFRLTAEGIDAPVEQLARELERWSVLRSRFRVCDVGETLMLEEHMSRSA